jgi:hypothetical protein
MNFYLDSAMFYAAKAVATGANILCTERVVTGTEDTHLFYRRRNGMYKLSLNQGNFSSKLEKIWT